MSLATVYLDGDTVYLVIGFATRDQATEAFIAMNEQVEAERKLELTIEFGPAPDAGDTERRPA